MCTSEGRLRSTFDWMGVSLGIRSHPITMHCVYTTNDWVPSQSPITAHCDTALWALVSNWYRSRSQASLRLDIDMVGPYR